MSEILGTCQELLALGREYPGLQMKYPIIALASVWRDDSDFRHVPGLYGGGAERRLGLRWFGYRWYGDYRFAAVRK